MLSLAPPCKPPSFLSGAKVGEGRATFKARGSQLIIRAGLFEKVKEAWKEAGSSDAVGAASVQLNTAEAKTVADSPWWAYGGGYKAKGTSYSAFPPYGSPVVYGPGSAPVDPRLGKCSESRKDGLALPSAGREKRMQDTANKVGELHKFC